MSFNYTRSQLKSRINAGIQGRIGMLISAEDLMNDAVRQVLQEVDLRSTRRRSTLSPNLFNGIDDYVCPTDMKGQAIIDLPGQANRADGFITIIPSNEFAIKRPSSAVAFDDYNGVRVLKINSIVNSHSIVMSELDSLLSGATANWAAFGDGTNLAADNDDYIKGNGSIKFDLSAAGGTTAGIYNDHLNNVDISDYLGGTSAIFVWAKINSPTNLTNYKLRIGNSASVYYEKTVTTQADGTAFVAGWNLLRFDLTSLTEVGSVVDTTITYAAIFMTKTSGKISETDYKFDWMVLKRGVITYVKYYSKYGWQTSAGAYIENSSAETDVLVADTDEFDLIVAKGRALAAPECDLGNDEEQKKQNEYDRMKNNYMQKNPSEALLISNEYYAYD